MKKQLVVMAILASLVLAVSCHRNPAFRSTPAPSVADPVGTNGSTPANTAPAGTATPSAPTTPPPPAGGRPAPGMLNADLAAGKAIYTGKCAKCHAVKPVENWTEQEWIPILKSMVKKARLDSIETQQVTLYVNTNAKRG